MASPPGMQPKAGFIVSGAGPSTLAWRIFSGWTAKHALTCVVFRSGGEETGRR